jgi:hypothetical protein
MGVREMEKPMKWRAGDWVEVRSKEEILRTLDGRGRLEELPFMPQMFEYCGQRFQVFKRAHKTCDTVNRTGGRRLSSAVHLELRCNGEAYGGCQAACLLFWKEAWLKPVDKADGQAGPPGESIAGPIPTYASTSCTEADVWAGTRAADPSETDEPTYVCQTTLLPYITTFLPWWDVRQYLEDYTSGNVTAGRLICGFVYAGYWEVLEHSGAKMGRALIRYYDKYHRLWGGLPFPRKMGTIPADQSTPTLALNLQPGELVRVRSHDEILATLNTEGKNRGLSFDAEQVPYCGGVYRVRSRVSRFIDEKTGKMKTLKNEAIILEGVWCQARYSDCRMLCPRSIYSWWREIWLERVHGNAESPDSAKP